MPRGACCRSISRRSTASRRSLIVAHRIVWSLAALALLVTALKGWPAGPRRARQPQGAGHAGAHRDADRGQLAALRLCDQLGPHPRRQPRLLSQPARQHPARPLLPRRASVAAAMGGGGDRRAGRRGARRGRARHVVDQPDPVLQLRHLRPAAQAGRGRFAQRADGRDAAARPVRARLSPVRGEPRHRHVRPRRRPTPGCWSPPGSSRPRPCCCSPKRRGACPMRRSACSSSSPRRCSSCSRSWPMASRSRAPTPSPSPPSGSRSRSTCRG